MTTKNQLPKQLLVNSTIGANPNKNECRTLERYGRVRIEKNTSVSVFYRGNTLWVLVLVRVIKSLVISFIRIRNRTHILLPRLNTGSNV